MSVSGLTAGAGAGDDLCESELVKIDS